MKAVVTAPFSDVFGIPHNVGDVIEISEYGFKKYEGFIKKPDEQGGKKKNGKRKSSSASKAASSDQQ